MSGENWWERDRSLAALQHDCAGPPCPRCPTPVPSEADPGTGEHLCGSGCQRCADHDPRDRRDHGHLTAEMCPACIAAEHHPKCYQSTGVPDDLPAGLCDCKVLRMLDAADAGDVDRRAVIQQAAEKYLSDFDTVMNVRSEARDIAVAIDRALASRDAATADRVRREAGAKALRDVADEWLSEHDREASHVARFLRERADRIAREAGR
jgi:hypothetical protein